MKKFVMAALAASTMFTSVASAELFIPAGHVIDGTDGAVRHLTETANTARALAANGFVVGGGLVAIDADGTVATVELRDLRGKNKLQIREIVKTAAITAAIFDQLVESGMSVAMAEVMAEEVAMKAIETAPVAPVVPVETAEEREMRLAAEEMARQLAEEQRIAEFNATEVDKTFSGEYDNFVYADYSADLLTWRNASDLSFVSKEAAITAYSSIWGGSWLTPSDATIEGWVRTGVNSTADAVPADREITAQDVRDYMVGLGNNAGDIAIFDMNANASAAKAAARPVSADYFETLSGNAVASITNGDIAKLEAMTDEIVSKISDEIVQIVESLESQGDLEVSIFDVDALASAVADNIDVSAIHAAIHNDGLIWSVEGQARGYTADQGNGYSIVRGDGVESSLTL